MNGDKWSRVLGPALAFSLLLQALTGWCLATFYAPSATTAWAAVAYIQQQVTLGWLVRGLHSAGASMTVTLLALHLLQAVWSGAYATATRRNWILGLAAGGLVLAFALTAISCRGIKRATGRRRWRRASSARRPSSVIICGAWCRAAATTAT